MFRVIPETFQQKTKLQFTESSQPEEIIVVTVLFSNNKSVSVFYFVFFIIDLQLVQIQQTHDSQV